MRNSTRRDFLKVVSGSILALSSLPAATSNILSPQAFNVNNLSSRGLMLAQYKQLHIIYNAWMNNESSPPSFYLEQAGIKLQDSTSISKHVKLDFEQNNTILVQGYILSKTEVAVLAATYSKLQ